MYPRNTGGPTVRRLQYKGYSIQHTARTLGTQEAFQPFPTNSITVFVGGLTYQRTVVINNTDVSIKYLGGMPTVSTRTTLVDVSRQRHGVGGLVCTFDTLYVPALAPLSTMALQHPSVSASASRCCASDAINRVSARMHGAYLAPVEEQHD